MCIQSYYNNTNQERIKLDLLKEIKSFGVEKWNKKVRNGKIQSQSKRKAKIKQ